jgi:hypothetical protein
MSELENKENEFQQYLHDSVFKAAQQLEMHKPNNNRRIVDNQRVFESDYQELLEPVLEFFKENSDVLSLASDAVRSGIPSEIDEALTVVKEHFENKGVKIVDEEVEEGYPENHAEVSVVDNQWIIRMDPRTLKPRTPLYIKELVHELGAWYIMSRGVSTPNKDTRKIQTLPTRAGQPERYQTHWIDRTFQVMSS